MNFEPRHGFLFHHVLIYPTNSFAEPVARAARVGIKPYILPLFIGRFEPREIQIENAAVYTPLRAPVLSTDAAEVRLAPSNVYSTIRFHDSAIAVEKLAADIFFLHLRARGNIARHRPAGGTRGAQALADELNALENAPTSIVELVSLISGMGGNAHPQLTVQFDTATTNPTALAQLSGDDIELQGEFIDTLRATIEWRDNTIHVRDTRATTAENSAALGVTFDLATRMTEVQLESTLPPGPLRVFLPSSMRQHLNAIGVEDGSGLRLSFHAGPARQTNLLATLSGTFSADTLVARGVTLASTTGLVTSAGDETHISGVQTGFGSGSDRGTGSGSFIWNREQRTLSGDISLNVNPNDFTPFLGSNTARLVKRFGFSEPLPHFTGTFRTHFAQDDLTINGLLAATNFSYRAVPLDRMTTTLAYSNHVVTLSDWRFTQTNGETKGTLTVDLHTDRAHADLFSTMNPSAVAGLVSPRLYDTVSSNRFEGPTEMHAVGAVDMGHGEENTDLILEARGERLGRGRWFADDATFTVHALGGSYIVTNIVGRAYGGDLLASLVVEPLSAGPDHRYTSHIVVSNAALALLAKEASVTVDPPPTGYVFLDIQLTGLVSEAIGPTTRGSGSIAVKNGALFRLPILGGLSELLSKLVPGLGFVSQTDMSCTFTIADGLISSDDLILAGDLLSLKAYGDIELDGRLNLRAQVKLLRRGPIASILRILTFPVTKLFEFQLTGTLDDPKWRPVNLPKELFLIFD